jgi:hypothetical protein
VDRTQWYYKESVSYVDMNSEGDAADGAVKKSAQEHAHPSGIVSGYEVSPGTGLTLSIGSSTSVAYDQLGRRLAPTAFPITQDISVATGPRVDRGRYLRQRALGVGFCKVRAQVCRCCC